MYHSYPTTNTNGIVLPLPMQITASTDPNASIRVEFVGSFDKIERRFPPALQTYMSVTSWTDFCDQVDEALVRMHKPRRVFFYILGLAIFAAVILVIVQILVYIGIIDEIGNTNNMSRFIPIYGIIAFVLISATFCSRNIYLAHVYSSIETQITKICADFSSRYPSLNIHFRPSLRVIVGEYSDGTTRYNVTPEFIEIEMTNRTTIIENTVSYNQDHPITIATPAFSEKSSMTVKSVTQRMAHLESIRSVISDQEYRNKRQEILSEV